jgi:glycosyltransferase involved in cell wall biosynthesis
MRATLLSRWDVHGGAAVACNRLHQGLLADGVESTLCCYGKAGVVPHTEELQPRRDFVARLRRRLIRRQIASDRLCYNKSRPSDSLWECDDRSEHASDLIAQLPPSDVLNLHWAHGCFDYRALFAALPKDLPLVWTLHDMHAFTGGCIFTLECDRFQRGCGCCPQLGSTKERDLAYRVFERKQQAIDAISREQLELVAPSQWLADACRRSRLFGRFRCHVCPNGVDTQAFAPQNKRLMREALGLAADERAILFIAASTTDRRKGITQLFEALRMHHLGERAMLLSLGRGCPNVPRGCRHRHLGYVANEHLLSIVYSAADVLVLPTLADNLPNVVLEAMACGTPTVAFDVGGLREMIEPGTTGLLVSPGSAVELGDCIASVLFDDSLRELMNLKSRERAVQEYSLDVQASRYIEIFSGLIAKSGQSSAPRKHEYSLAQ